MYADTALLTHPHSFIVGLPGTSLTRHLQGSGVTEVDKFMVSTFSGRHCTIVITTGGTER